MNTENFIDEIVTAYRETGQGVLPPRSRDQLVSLLERLAVDREGLTFHICNLAELFGPLDVDDPLSADDRQAVYERRWPDVPDVSIALLLLCPIGIIRISEYLFENLPNAWDPVFEELGALELAEMKAWEAENARLQQSTSAADVTNRPEMKYAAETETEAQSVAVSSSDGRTEFVLEPDEDNVTVLHIVGYTPQANKSPKLFVVHEGRQEELELLEPIRDNGDTAVQTERLCDVRQKTASLLLRFE